MAQRQSTGLCNYVLDTGSLKAAFPDMRIRVYSGVVPASADAAIGSATLLNEVKYSGGDLSFDAAAAGGVLLKNAGETWVGTNTTGGTASFYRVVNAADDGTLSTVFKRLQGTIGVGGADMNVGLTALTSGSTFTLNYFSQSMIPS